MRSTADAGLVRARTALAWQRTALSIAAAAAVMARLTWGALGGVAVATLTIAVVLSCWVYLESSRRDRSRSGRAPLALALCIALVAGTELAALLST